MDVYIKGKKEKVSLYYDGESVVKDMLNNSDNQCEWEAVVFALESIHDGTIKAPSYSILIDSVLLYRQIIGVYRIKSKNLKPIYFKWNRLKNLLWERKIEYEYILSEDNLARGYMNK